MIAVRLQLGSRHLQRINPYSTLSAQKIGNSSTQRMNVTVPDQNSFISQSLQLFMKATKELSEEIVQNLEFHSMANLNNSSDQLSLYKLSIKPYDYYLKYRFEGDLARVQFYQQLASMSNLIVASELFQIHELEESYFNQFFSLSQKNIFSITCYLRYYNYTLKSWIHHQKECGSVISEQEILMVLKQLLTFQIAYYGQYRQCCHVFKSDLIYVTPEKTLRLYAHFISYNGQIAVHRDSQAYLNSSKAKLDKQFSIQTTLTNSQVQYQPTQQQECFDEFLKQDVRDIFILLMEMLSFKRYDHFLSKKHGRVIWDSVKDVLNSTQVSHLSEQFLELLRDCVSSRVLDADYLLSQIERIISSKNRMCKTIHIERNQQLAQLVLKREQEIKEKKLQGLRFLHRKDLQKGLSKYNSF